MLLQITFAQGCANFCTSPSIVLDRMLRVIIIRSLKNARQRGADLDTLVIIIVLTKQAHVENPGALWVHVYPEPDIFPGLVRLCTHAAGYVTLIRSSGSSLDPFRPDPCVVTHCSSKREWQGYATSKSHEYQLSYSFSPVHAERATQNKKWERFTTWSCSVEEEPEIKIGLVLKFHTSAQSSWRLWGERRRGYRPVSNGVSGLWRVRKLPFAVLTLYRYKDVNTKGETQPSNSIPLSYTFVPNTCNSQSFEMAFKKRKRNKCTLMLKNSIKITCIIIGHVLMVQSLDNSVMFLARALPPLTPLLAFRAHEWTSIHISSARRIPLLRPHFGTGPFFCSLWAPKQK